jgi:hypothetical protein
MSSHFEAMARCVMAILCGACLATSFDVPAASTTFQVHVTVRKEARIASETVSRAGQGPPASARSSALASTTRLRIEAPGAELRMHFTAVDKNVRHIEVRGLGRPVTLGREGGRTSTVLGEGRSHLEIDCSIVYEKDVAGEAGTPPLKATLEIVF